jgi:PBS lyase HEAT-like repeat
VRSIPWLVGYAPSAFCLAYPRAGQFDPLAIDAVVCLRKIAAYGQDGQGAGQDPCCPFSPRRMETSALPGPPRWQPSVINLLCQRLKRHSAKFPELVKCSSPDWRGTYAAVRGIGWLGDQQALPDLQKVASSHWLPEVRDEATRTMAALRSPKGRLEGTWKFIPSEGVGEPFEIDHEILDKAPSCSSQRCAWNGTTFKLRPDQQTPDTQGGMSLQFIGGRLEGTNHGEFSGTLTWQSVDRSAKPQVIFRDDVVSMANDGDARWCCSV